MLEEWRYARQQSMFWKFHHDTPRRWEEQIARLRDVDETCGERRLLNETEVSIVAAVCKGIA